MVPSYGYAGVDTGPAKVIGILHYPTEGNWTMLEHHEGYITEIDESMKAFIEAELSIVDENNQSREYPESYSALQSEPWVAYRYLRGINGGVPEVQVFPLSLFISHSVPAI
jgi:hypothetical protein